MSVTASRPIVERIAVEVYERLRLLLAGTESGLKVRDVIRPKRIEDFSPTHLQVVLTQAAPEAVPELSFPGNPPAKAMSVVFNIHCHIKPSEKDPTPLDEYANVFEAEVVKAITNDGMAYWQTFGGLAIDAEYGPREQIAADGGIDGFTLPLSVTYRTSERDPYTLRT